MDNLESEQGKGRKRGEMVRREVQRRQERGRNTKRNVGKKISLEREGLGKHFITALSITLFTEEQWRVGL